MKYLLLLFVLIFSACGKSNASQPLSDFQVQGQEASAFFKQFIYRASGECPDVLYQLAESDPYLKVGSTADGEDILAGLQVMMHEDGTFEANYVEQNVFKYTESGYQIDASRLKRVKGAYQVEGTDLILEGLGVGKALSWNGSPAFLLQMEEDLLSPGLKEKALVMVLSKSSAPPLAAYDICKSSR